MADNSDIKRVLEAINGFTPIVKSEDLVALAQVNENVRITKEGIEEAWDNMGDDAVVEGGEEVTLTVNTPTEIKVAPEQADMITNMLKLAGIEVNDTPVLDAPDADIDGGDIEDLPMVIPTDDEAGEDEAPLMGACASEGEEEQPTEAKKPDADGDGIPDWADKDEDEDEDEKKNEAEEVVEAKDKMVCKHCGDEMHKPASTSCECDCADENGDNWVKESIEESETLDLAEINRIVELAGLEEGRMGFKDLDKLGRENASKVDNEARRRGSADMEPGDADRLRYQIAKEMGLVEATVKEDDDMARTARILQARIRKAMLKSQSGEEVSTEEFKELQKLARILQARISGVTSGPDYDSNGDAVTEGASKSKMIDDAESMSMGEFVEEYSAQGMSDEEAKQAYKEIMGEAIGKDDDIIPETSLGLPDPVVEAITTTDLITKYQGTEIDVNDMNRLLKLSGLGNIDESKLANSPAGTSMDEPKEFDKLPSAPGQGAGNSDYINRADGQGENPMGMHTADDVEESFQKALGEYRKFISEGIMSKKSTKKAKK
jgi:hypothetical protein